MGPGTTEDEKGMEETHRGHVGRFAVGTSLAGSNEGACVSVHGRPPKVPLKELHGPVGPWVAGETGAMSPLQDLGPHGIGHKAFTGRSVPWVRLVTEGLVNAGINILCQSSYHWGGRQNGILTRGGV